MKYDINYGARKQQERKARQAEAARKARIRRMQIVGAAVCILAFVAMGFTVLPQQYRHSDIPLTTVSVVPGDTIWDIASDHAVESMTVEDTVSFIKEVNNISGSTLRAGEELKVPATPVQEVATTSVPLDN